MICKVLIMIIPLIATADNFDVHDLYKKSSDYIVTPENLIKIKHSLVIDRLNEIHDLNNAIELMEIGQSAEGRSINMFSFGSGDTKLLLWSQMHGDEPSATAGLLAVFNFIAQNFDTPFIQDLYRNLTIHAIIMLNPDGAEKYQRRNAQGIDINRDANRLASPEGQILKKMKEQTQPDFGFNLHDMRGRETVTDIDSILTIALMAPPYNKANEDNPSRERAKKLAVIIKEVLDRFIPGHVARYKAGYMPRAFGDAFQNWGVSTVLIESGLSNKNEPHYLVRLNFITLFSAFNAIATGSVDNADESAYDQIPLEGIEQFDLLIREARVYNGRCLAPYTADIGINVDYRLENEKIVGESIIEDMGDLSVTSGREVIDAGNLIVMPGLIVKNGKNKTVEDLLKIGITTPVSQNSQIVRSLPKDSIIPLLEIPSYTSEAANSLQLKNVGLIDKNMSADLLIFDSTTDDELSLENLRYVIKNGKIVYKK